MHEEDGADDVPVVKGEPGRKGAGGKAGAARGNPNATDLASAPDEYAGGAGGGAEYGLAKGGATGKRGAKGAKRNKAGAAAGAGPGGGAMAPYMGAHSGDAAAAAAAAHNGVGLGVNGVGAAGAVGTDGYCSPRHQTLVSRRKWHLVSWRALGDADIIATLPRH